MSAIDMSKVMELAASPKTAEEVWAGCMAADGIMEMVTPVSYDVMINTPGKQKVFAFYKHAKFEFSSIEEMLTVFEDIKTIINHMLVLNGKEKISLRDLMAGFGYAFFNEETKAMLELDTDSDEEGGFEDDEEEDEDDDHNYVGIDAAALSVTDATMLDTEGADFENASPYVFKMNGTSYNLGYSSSVRLFIACRDFVEEKFDFENIEAYLSVSQEVKYTYDI